MSGIAALVRFDGRPVDRSDARGMAAAMAHRGPHGQNIWAASNVALAHCLLRTTEEAVDEAQPLANEDQGVVLVLDGWLQNWLELRSELLARGVVLRSRADSELVLRAYEVWGHACTAHLHGDFAFVIWDSRRNEVFCARDRFGMRPFHYYHVPGVELAIASDPEAILALPRIPRKIDDTRVADALVGDLEGLDHTSTFFFGISRLPPAHQMIVSPRGLRIAKYWQFEPPEPLRMRSDAHYAEALSEVLTQAVSCRLRGGAATAAMLSGGLDSSAVVATARTIKFASGAEPLRTFSAVGPDARTCAETRAIHAVVADGGLNANYVDHADLGSLLPELIELTLSPTSPFDTHMTLVRAVYLSASRAGMHAVLDGVGGDLVLADGGFIPYLIRRGRWLGAVREIRKSAKFWQHDARTVATLLKAARSAATPDWARRIGRRFGWHRPKWQRHIDRSLIDPDFAQSIGLLQRFEREAAYNAAARYRPGSAAQRAAIIFHAHNTAARERYEREAARLGIQPRDPFLDTRMISFCASLPVTQTVRQGWTKFALRNAMAGRLPDEVRWRRGKSHLGWVFTRTVMQAARTRFAGDAHQAFAQLSPFVSPRTVTEDWEAYLHGALPNDERAKLMTRVLLTSRWLAAQRQR